MGVGQAAVAPLSISLISDMRGVDRGAVLKSDSNANASRGIPRRRILAVFMGASVLYVGVYVGEAVSGQIATAFTSTDSDWRTALEAIGITGIVMAVVLRVVLREPSRKSSLVQPGVPTEDEKVDAAATDSVAGARCGVSSMSAARVQLRGTVSHVIRLRSFWLLVLSGSFRQ